MKFKFDKKKILNILFPVITLFAVLAIWFIAARAIGVELVLPSPWAAIEKFFALLGEGVFWHSVFSTLGRSLYSFLLAFAAGVALALPAFFSETFYRLFNPVVMVMRAVPTMSVILLCMIWLTSAVSPVVIAFLIVFPVIFGGTYSALKGVDEKLGEMSRLYKVSRGAMAVKLYIPGIAPSLLDTARSAVGLNLKVLIAAEVLASTQNSIGNMLQLSKVYLDTPSLFAWTIAAILLSFLLEGAVALIKRLSLRWLYV